MLYRPKFIPGRLHGQPKEIFPGLYRALELDSWFLSALPGEHAVPLVTSDGVFQGTSGNYLWSEGLAGSLSEVLSGLWPAARHPNEPYAICFYPDGLFLSYRLYHLTPEILTEYATNADLLWAYVEQLTADNNDE
jgi:hypothetical protein